MGEDLGEGDNPLHLMERVRVRQGEGDIPLPQRERLLRRQPNQATDHDLTKILDFPAIAHFNEHILNIRSKYLEMRLFNNIHLSF